MTTITKDNNIMATANPDSDQIGSNNFSENSAEAQGSGQLTDVNPSPNSGFICSQLVSDPKPKASEKATTTTNNNNSNNSNSSSSSSSVSSNCSNSVLATVTKVVTSDEEQEDFLAEIDSDLPNFLSRTWVNYFLLICFPSPPTNIYFYNKIKVFIFKGTMLVKNKLKRGKNHIFICIFVDVE